jgi:hypothetical protein
MFGISWDQISGLVQRVLMFAGGFVVAKGWISEELMIQIVGALVGLGGILWGVKVNTQSALVASVTAMPEVDSNKLAAAISDPSLKDAARPS